jgi:hypothetical protein
MRAAIQNLLLSFSYDQTSKVEFSRARRLPWLADGIAVVSLCVLEDEVKG